MGARPDARLASTQGVLGFRPVSRGRISLRQYLEAETGTIRKEAEFRLALVYPSPYRAAMSSLGYQTIYRRLNAVPGIAADRAVLPDDTARPARC